MSDSSLTDNLPTVRLHIEGSLCAAGAARTAEEATASRTAARHAWHHAAAAAVLTVALLSMFTLLAHPVIVRGTPVGADKPDGYDYVYGAVALLRGQYVVDWDGTERVPRYPPGFSTLLAPAVAAGGIEAGVWVPFGAALALGVLAALLAARLGGPFAAPCAVVAVLFGVGPILFARLVLSDVPSAALLVLEVALLALGRGRASSLAAGLVAGGLAWVRYADVVLALAGLCGLTARPDWRRRAAWYLAGAVPPLLLLAGWQFATFGSPLTTTYHAWLTTLPEAERPTFFSLHYALGQPAGMDSRWHGGIGATWHLPNSLLYPVQFLGADGFLTLPGVGLLGFIAMLRAIRRGDASGVVGRFGLAAVAGTLVVYVPYFYQSGRFLMAPAALLGVSAATMVPPLLWAASRGFSAGLKRLALRLS